MTLFPLHFYIAATLSCCSHTIELRPKRILILQNVLFLGFRDIVYACNIFSPNVQLRTPNVQVKLQLHFHSATAQDVFIVGHQSRRSG